MNFKDIKYWTSKQFNEDYNISILKSNYWLYNEYIVSIRMKKGDKEFLSITQKSNKSYDINEELMELILYVGFLELYQKFSDYLFTIDEYKLTFLWGNKTICCTSQRTGKMSFIQQENITQAIKDLMTVTDLNLKFKYD